MSQVRRFGLVLLAAGLSACTMAPAPEMPGTVVALPNAYNAPVEDGAHEPLEWWKSFEDPTLDALVERALEANLDLREAVARLDELRHRYRVARAPLLPSITANVDGNRSDTPGNTGFGGSLGGEDGDTPADTTNVFPFSFPDRFAFTTYSASLGFAYELDFWGRARNETNAAINDFLASRADAETARMGVIGSTVSTYLELVSNRERVTLAEENLDLLRERAELTEQRYQAGLVSSFELYNIRQEYRNAQADLPSIRTELADAEGRLAVILGRYAGAIDDLIRPRATLDPTTPTDPIPAGLPVTLLNARPDVLAAFERLEAARYRVGARRAELLPTISLNGSVGFQSSEPDNLFRPDQWFLNLVGGIVAPLFQGGRLRANVGIAQAQYDQAIAAYVRTVLNAYHEVRISLIRLENEGERYARVLDQVEDAQASLDLQLRRFRSGVGDYVSYLDARRNLIGAETTLSLVERGVGEARLGVHRALGGAWTEDGIQMDGPQRTRAVAREHR